MVPMLVSELEIIGQMPWRLTFSQALNALSGEGSEAADAALAEFATTQVWPVLSEKCRWEVCARLACVIRYCQELPDEPILGMYEDPKEFLMSVGIMYWRDVGRENWIAQALFQRESGW